jgi:hypothetical protein
VSHGRSEENTVAGRRKRTDVELVLTLACGASPESAAQKTGLSLRTVYRRLADPAFLVRVREVRADLVQRMAGVFTAASTAALKTLTVLQESATSESVRLGAARAILEIGSKLRESADLGDRVAAMESRLEELLDGPAESPEAQSP